MSNGGQAHWRPGRTPCLSWGEERRNASTFAAWSCINDRGIAHRRASLLAAVHAQAQWPPTCLHVAGHPLSLPSAIPAAVPILSPVGAKVLSCSGCSFSPLANILHFLDMPALFRDYFPFPCCSSLTFPRLFGYFRFRPCCIAEFFLYAKQISSTYYLNRGKLASKSVPRRETAISRRGIAISRRGMRFPAS